MLVMEIRKRVLDEQHPDSLTSMRNLGVTNLEQDRRKEAMMPVIKARMRLFGEKFRTWLRAWPTWCMPPAQETIEAMHEHLN